jgi:hypothetical protein
MELTNEQRLLVYKELLKAVCKDPSVEHGMCSYLIRLLDHNSKMPYNWHRHGGLVKMNALTELNRRDNGRPYWAPLTEKGWEKRIGWIEKAIIDVKKKIK